MNKKFLSAILFGALMVTSTGTFVSCKDYDDDIENLQGQISANASAIAELKALIGDGNYVTGISVNGQNLVVNMKNGSTTIALPECEDKVGSICNVEGGILYIDGVATDIKVCEPSEENDFKEAVKIENGEWVVLQEDDTYKSTGILASSVTAVQNADESWTLTIKDAEGNAQEVKVPSAASLVTSLSFANPTFETIDVAAPFVYNAAYTQMKNVAGDKYPYYAVVSPLNKNGQRGVAVDVLVEPVNVDPADLTFKLVNSKGQTVFAEAVVTEAPTLTRSTSNGVYRLYFAYADGLTRASFDDYYGGFASRNHALAVVCGKASTEYAVKNTYAAFSANTAEPVVEFNTTYVKLGATYNLFSNGWSTNPTSTPSGWANLAFLKTFTGVTDIKLSVADDVAAAYGVTVDGYNFTISSEAAYGKTIPLKVTYTGVNSTGSSAWTITKALNVTVQTKPINMGATLSASHVLSVNTASNSAAMYAYIPLENLANSITGEAKIAWNAATSLDYAVVNANNTTTAGLNLTSSTQHNYTWLTMKEGVELTDISLVKSNKQSAANLAQAAYIKVKVVPTSANVAVDTYKANIEFTFAGKKAYADVELTLTNPATLTRIPSLFNGDNVIAYGVGTNGTGENFDVKSVYETTGAQYDNFRIVDVQTVSGLANWTWTNVSSNTNLGIVTSTMYKAARKVKVQWEVFAGATNNSFTDVIYITAQSPIYDGTVTTSKTTLSLGQSKSAVFTESDFTALDVWGNAYHMFAYQYADGKDANGDPIYKWADYSTSKIQQPITVTADSDLVEVTMNTVGSGTYAASQKGFTVKVKESAAIQTGATINITIKLVDDWGKEKSIPVTLTVVE